MHEFLCTPQQLSCDISTTTGFLPYQYESDIPPSRSDTKRRHTALATVLETGVRSFCDHDAVFALRSSSLQATIYARRTLHLRRVGRGQKQIGHWSWHEQIDLQHRKDTVKTRLLPDGRLHGGRQSSRMCVMGKGTRCLTLVPRHLHSPRASVAGRCLQMLRVCNILYCIALHWPQCLRHRSSRLSV